MTRHPEEGILQAFLDDELPPAAGREIRAHVERCAACRLRLGELGALADVTSRVLSEADSAVPSVDRARWAVRRAHSERRRHLRRRWSWAASVVLLFGAGAAAAMPGSPLRSWWETRTASSEWGPATEAAVQEGEPVSVAGAGVGVPALDGAVRLEFADVPPGTAFEVRIVAGDRAYALPPTGATFESGPGRIRVELGPVGGPVRIEVPLHVYSEVLAGGHLLLRIDEGQVFDGTTTVPAAVGQTVHLSAPGGDTDGPDSEDGVIGGEGLDYESGGQGGPDSQGTGPDESG